MKISMENTTKNGYNLDIKNPHIPEAEKSFSSKELLDMLHVSMRKIGELLTQLKKELN